MSLSPIKNNHLGFQSKVLRSGTGSASPNQQSASEVALPQSNGVNITIINPTTNVSSATAGSGEKTTPNPADSFTPSTQSATTMPMLQPLQQPAMAALPPASTNTGGASFQQQPVYF